MSDDLKRLEEAAFRWDERTIDKHGHKRSYERIARSVVAELRKVTPEMRQAMLNTEWPEGMSASEQVDAMFQAAIDVIVKD